MSFAPAVGCGCVVGAEALSESSGVWFKTRFYQDGNYLCATVYSVAAGEPRIVELRVDIRPIARALMRGHSALHAREMQKASVRGKPLVGWSLGKMWKGVKKAAKAIGRTKLVKGVVGVTKTIAKGAKAVIKSKAFGAVLGVAAVFPLTAPFGAVALGAYASANAAVAGVEAGAKVVQTAQAAASLLKQGKRVASQVSTAKAKAHSIVKTAGASMTPAARAQLASKARAAGQLKLNAKGKATVAASLARAPAGAARAKVAASIASRMKALSTVRTRTVLAKTLPKKAGSAVVASTQLELHAAPIVARAAATAKKLANPTVRASLVDISARAAQAKAALESVQTAAATGSLDAQKTAAIVNLVARNRARIQAMSQTSAGGLPGVLITRQGKLVRGRFRVQASANASGTLYQGPGKPGERGAFTTVGSFAPFTGSFAPLTGSFAPLTAGFPELVGKGVAGCYSVNGRVVGIDIAIQGVDVAGDLPMDGVRLTGRGANSYDIGPYEVGCDCNEARPA